MPIPIKPTVPPVPQRTQSPTVFSDNVDEFLTFIPAAVDYFDEATTFTDTRATAADASAVSALASKNAAEISAASAEAVSSFKGFWSSLSGAINKPASVYHNGAYWALLNNLANITLSEPGVTGDWLFSNGTRWSPVVTATSTLNANQLAPVYSAASAIDLTQPTFATRDFLIVHNSPSSVGVVRLLNPSNSIRGKTGIINAGDNLVLNAGETVHLYARSSTILEVI